jgi:hypothetical protein
MHSSLNAVGWGLAYPDFLRLACLLCVPFIREVDRGQALEQAWLQAEGIDKTSLPTVTLAQWKADVQQVGWSISNLNGVSSIMPNNGSTQIT